MREQQSLTLKARAAITRYVILRLDEHGQTLDNAVKFTLQAERLRRQTLYEWLEARNYRWRAKHRAWVLTATPIRQQKTGSANPV